jgi:hypothetical protein
MRGGARSPMRTCLPHTAAFINREKYSEFCDFWEPSRLASSKKSPIYGLFYHNSQR